jgi:hypothetical protein
MAVNESALYVAAWRNARDFVASSRARVKRQQIWSLLHFRDGMSDPSECEDAFVHACKRIARILPDDKMREIFRLLAEGERSTSAYAAILGVGSRPVPEQRHAVKNAKDKLYKFLRRNRSIRLIAEEALEWSVDG